MKKTWKIDIDCSNCAAKVERALQKLPGVVSASVNYVQKKITLEAADDRFEKVRKAAYAKMKEIEPDAEIFFDEAGKPSGASCACGGHHHEDDDEDEHEHHHHHDHDEDHDHEHHHEHDENCTCGCHDHDHDHHHHHHHADEVFTSWGIETPNTYSAEDIEKILTALDSGEYGAILRAKGMVPAPDGTWVYYDYVPEEHDIRSGKPEVTGKICVIGSKLDEDKLAELFRK